MQLLRVHLALFVQHGFLGLHVHDPAHDAVHVLGVQKLQQLALHGHRELLDDGRVDLVARNGVISGALELVVDLVAGGDAEEVGHVHVRLVGDGHGESLARLDVQPGALARADEQYDLVLVADLAPRHVHHVDLFVLVIGRHHQHRHRIDRRHDAQILFHNSLLLFAYWPPARLRFYHTMFFPNCKGVPHKPRG